VNWTSVRAALGTVIRLGLAAVWLFAGLAKVREPAAFVRAVRAYDVTPEWLSQAIGYGLPILEICLAVLLVLGLVTRAVSSPRGAADRVHHRHRTSGHPRIKLEAAASAAAVSPPRRPTCWTSPETAGYSYCPSI
jgi:hypothetical protein